MNNLEELDKLNTFKEKGIISEEEFQQQKKILLNQPQMGNKSQLCYVLLAFFFGVLGVHNFYAGRWKRGLAQLLITLLTLLFTRTAKEMNFNLAQWPNTSVVFWGLWNIFGYSLLCLVSWLLEVPQAIPWR